MADLTDFYFFRLDHYDLDLPSEYRIAKSFVDLSNRLGASYLSKFRMITQLNRVTSDHISAINSFLSTIS